MLKIGSKTVAVLLLILADLEAVTVLDHSWDDDYYALEHQVLYDDALSEAKNLKLSPSPSPGCKSCTNEEMTYCTNGNVIKDHCCCDSAHDKTLPFVQHTCLIGRKACTPLADDCAEYTRLRECCCHAYLGSVWKYRAGGVEKIQPNILIVIGITPMLQLFWRFL